MATVDVALVRRVGKHAVSRPLGHRLYFELTWSEQTRLTARNRNRVEMTPAIALPGKSYLTVARPEQLRIVVERVELPAGSCVSRPNRPPAGAVIPSDPDRPRRFGAEKIVRIVFAKTRHADKGQRRSVGRPFRVIV